MDKSYIFIFLYSLSLCYVISSAYFQFDEITVDFFNSLSDKVKINTYTLPLRYVNWIVPLVTPILINFVRPLRFNIHQGLIFSLVSLIFMNIIFYVVEFLVLTESTLNLKFIIIKISLLQLLFSLILCIVYWINFMSLISHSHRDELILVQSCFILTTVFGKFKIDMTFKSYFIIYELAIIALYVLYYILWRLKIEMKDDFKPLPLLDFTNFVLKKTIVCSSFIESAFLGGIVFLYLLPFFVVFLLTFIPTQNRELLKINYQKLGTATYFPFLIGLAFGTFFLSTFSHLNIKKTIWSMMAKNLIFIYIWSLIIDFKVPYYYFSNIQNGLLFFAISINFLVQSITIVEELRNRTNEERETVSLFTIAILLFGFMLSWLFLTTILGIKIYYFDSAFSDTHISYLYASFLIGLFLCTFNQIINDHYRLLPTQIHDTAAV